MASAFASVGSVLTRIAHRFGLETHLLEHRLRRHWPEVAGEQIAAHTRPDQVRFKKLYLVAESSVWAQQLTFLKPALIEKINAAGSRPIISDIVLRVGEVREVKSPKEKGKSEEGLPQEPVPLPECLAQAAVHGQHVKDPELRAQLTTVMARALSTPRPSRK